MMNSINSFVPYQNYPYNATGATPVTKDIASYCYDTQRPDIGKTYGYLTSDHKPSYTWPLVGAVVSAISLLTVAAMRFRGR